MFAFRVLKTLIFGGIPVKRGRRAGGRLTQGIYGGRCRSILVYLGLV